MDPLESRRFGASPLSLTRLGFGGAPLGGPFREVSDDEAEATVTAAREAGIGYFDTAPLYGHGLSEHRVGRALWRVPRDSFVLSTKVGRLLRPRGGPGDGGQFLHALPFEPHFDYGYDATLRSLEDSLQRLGLDRVDIALIHDVSPRWHGDGLERRFVEAMEGAYPALDKLRGEGVIGAIGVGVNDPAICLRFARAGRFDGFMLAGRYTLLDQSGLDALLPHCLAENIAVLLAGPFNSGILATGAVEGATYFYAPADAKILQRTRRIEAVCARHGVPLAAAALQFPAAHAAITSVVTGFRSPAEVEANLRLFRLPIPSALWRDLKSEGLIRADAPVPGGDAA